MSNKTPKHIPSNVDTTKVIKMSMKDMKEAVIKNAQLFYQGEQTEISDFQYDAMIKLILEKDPTFDIYDYINNFADGIRAYHDEGIYRDYVKNADISEYATEEDFEAYKKDYIILPKFDGSSITCYYENNTLDKIISRGDDESGIVQTEKLRNKVKANMKNTKYVFCECIVSKDNGGRAKANGLVNSKTMQDDVNKYLTVIPWDCMTEDGKRFPNTEVEVTDYKVFERIRDKAEWVNPKTNEVYPVDGIVGYKRKSKDYTLDIHKLYYSEAKETILRDIEWAISDTSGVMHPVAIFDTVELDDTNVSKASMYNYQWVKDSGCYIGCKIKVAKANLTIPQILEVLNPDEKKCSKMIEELSCPECGGNIIEYGNVDCICNDASCKWWYNLILERILWSEGIFTDEEYSFITQTECDDFTYLKKAIDKDKIIKIFKDIEYLIEIYSIPRINKKNKKLIIDGWKASCKKNMLVSDCIDLFETVCTDVLSELMSSYVSIFNIHLKSYLSKLKMYKI